VDELYAVNALQHQTFLNELRKPNVPSHTICCTTIGDNRSSSILPDAEYARKFENDLVALAPDKGKEILARYLDEHFHFFQSICGWVFFDFKVKFNTGFRMKYNPLKPGCRTFSSPNNVFKEPRAGWQSANTW
jgi:hypothetical protein